MQNPKPEPFFTPYRFILIILVLIFGWVFTNLAWDLHAGMRTHKADLGQVSQAIWNSSQGRFVEMTDNGPLSTRLTDHVEPFLALISPVLWLWRDVKALLLLQVVFAAAGGWLLYEIAVNCFKSMLSPTEQMQVWHVEPLRNLTGPLALALVLGFFLSPQIQNALLTEFHAAPLATPLILWAFYTIEKIVSPTHKTTINTWIQFALATLLTASVKEEMALLAAGLGVWAIYRLTIKGLWKSKDNGKAPGLHKNSVAPSPCHLVTLSPCLLIPLIVTALCLLWFYLATFVIVPAYAVEVYETAENPYWARYGALGDSPVDIIKSLFTQPLVVFQIVSEPVRVHYLWTMLASFGFLSLLAPEILLLSLPLLLANLLSEYPPQYYGEFHYSAPLVAYFGVSAVYGAKRLGQFILSLTQSASPSFQHMPAASSWVMALVAMVRNSRTTLRPLLFGVVALWVVGWNIVGYVENSRGPWGGRVDSVNVNNHHRLLARFVAQIPADAAVTATAAVHPHVALRRFVYQFPIGIPEFGEQGNAEWALLDVTTNTDMAPGDLRDRVMQMLAAEWGIVDGADGYILLRKGAPEKQIPDAFFDFARVPLEEVTVQSPSAEPVEAPSTEPVEAHLSLRQAQGAAERSGAMAEDSPLALIGLEVDDWPRWRSTKVITTWQVGPGFDPAQHGPKLSIHRPSGEPLYSFSDGTSTAIIWYPPDLWQSGDIIAITTGALTLPQVWGVLVNASAAPHNDLPISDKTMTLVASYSRGTQNDLITMPLPPHLNNAAEALAYLGHTRADQNPRGPNRAIPVSTTRRFNTKFITGIESGFTMKSQLGRTDAWPTGMVNLLLRWHGDELLAWPGGLTPFVHLRQFQGESGQVNLAQQDGPPRWFLVYNTAPFISQGKPLWDWRQLPMPAADMLPADILSDRKFDLVVGLYDPTSGERAEVLEADGKPIGNEAIVGRIQISQPPVPDFTCAMSPASCMAQPIKQVIHTNN